MDKKQKGYLLLLYLISPFLGIVNVFKIKEEKALTFFGTLFFGLVGSAYIYGEGSDGQTHLMNAKKYYIDMSLGEFFTKAYEVLTFSSTEGGTDLYLHIISFLSTSVLQSPSLTHLFAGMVLGYFFTKSVLLVMKDNLQTRKGYILLGFIVLFLLIRSLGALNSIRMWTGMWVMFYGTYSYAINKEKKNLYIILFSVIVHFSYAIILIPFLVTYLMQKKKYIVVGLYVMSFFATASFSFIESYIPKLDLIEKKQNTYAIDSDKDAERFKERNLERDRRLENVNFYKASGETNYLNYSIVGLSAILIFFYLKKAIDANLNFLIAIGLGLYAFANVVTFLPSLQGRTKTIAATFILAAAIYLQLNLKNYELSIKNKKLLNSGFGLFLISSIPMIMFQVSYIFQNFSFYLILFPQVSWILGDEDSSIRSVIGLLID
jgi:hypothetical protein